MTRQATREATRHEYARAWASKLGWLGGVDPYEREQLVANDPETERNADGKWQIGGIEGTEMTDEEIFAELGIEIAVETQTEEQTEVATEAQPTETTEVAEVVTKPEIKKSRAKKANKEEKAMTNKDGARANRVVVRADETGYVAEFFKTHKSIATVNSADTGWSRNKDHNSTQAREDFRTWIQTNASEFGVAWMPEYQAQAWDRHYWKYETDEQVEEDACTLMTWTIRKLAEANGSDLEVTKISLDAIVPNDSPLSYVEHGKYVKNGNWAVATVNLAVTLMHDGKEEDIIYPIEMRSGQLTKIKMNKAEFQAMVQEVFAA